MNSTLDNSPIISFISLCCENYIICSSQKGNLLHGNGRNIIAPKQEASVQFHLKELWGCTNAPGNNTEGNNSIWFCFGISTAATLGSLLNLFQPDNCKDHGEPRHRYTVLAYMARFLEGLGWNRDYGGIFCDKFPLCQTVNASQLQDGPDTEQGQAH